MELIKDGKNIRVTNENKKQYGKKIARYYLSKDVKIEVREFLKGFYQVIPHNVISVFDNDELEFLMSGAPEISIDDWKQNTIYKGDFQAKGQNHQVV